MEKLKQWLCYNIFKKEINAIREDYRKEYDAMIKRTICEEKCLAEIRRVFNDRNGCIVSIEKNKKNQEVIVVQRIHGKDIEFLLYGAEYKRIGSRPRIEATRWINDDKHEDYVEINDIFAINENIGNGSILMNWFIDYCKSIKVKSVKGSISSVDVAHMDCLKHFYEKYSFIIWMNDEKSSGTIRLDLSSVLSN